MKRMLFGIGLLLSGVVGFVGWCIAATLTVELVQEVIYGDVWMVENGLFF